MIDQFQIKFLNRQQLPLVLEPTHPFTWDQFLKALTKCKGEIEKNVSFYGGVLLRGFPVEGADAFHAVVETLGFGKSLNYVGGDTPRDKVKDKVYTATEAPPKFKIPLHNEMSFIKRFPRHIYFYCDHPPAKDGETIIADARQVYQSIDRDVRDRFGHKGLRYISNFYGKSWVLDKINQFRRAHKTWMDAFETKSSDDVERLCRENEFGYKWMPRNWLQVIYESPAVLSHPLTQEKVWFNQAHLYDYNPRLCGMWYWLGTKMIYVRKHTAMHEIYFGDGSKVPKRDLYHVMDILDKATVKFPWQKGDLLILDNILTMHGRAPFEGKRKILVSMTR